MTDTLTIDSTDDEMDGPAEDTAEPVLKLAGGPLVKLHRILELSKAGTLADELSETELAKIASDVVDDLGIDEESRKEWMEGNEKAIKFARQISEAKTFPWAGAANVMYPLIAEAAVQFNARAYPAIVAGKDLVKFKVLGADPQGQKAKKGERVAKHMSSQLLDDMPEWEEDTDRLTMMLPVIGHMYRKVWWDGTLKRNCSELMAPDKVVVNDNVKSIVKAPRITQLIDLYPYEIEERMREGQYRRVEVDHPQGEDKETPHVIVEQHRRLDLDDDGYPEPYIVTVHKETLKVLRIEANYIDTGIRASTQGGKVTKITPFQYFVPYRFLPDPNGGFHGMGFGRLLGATNEVINSVINRLLDAGTMATLGGGFIGSGARLGQSGAITFKPMEWKRVDVPGTSLRENIVPLPVKEPSPVLFSLLELLVQMGKDLAATKDILTGDNISAQMPATLGLALIEQGLKVFTAIYKRIHRALKTELGLLFTLNSLYLNPEAYQAFQDDPEAASQEDYDEKSIDIVPITDPSEVTDMQRLAKAQFLEQFRGDPMMNAQEIRTRTLQAANVDDIPKLFNPNPQPPPEAVKIQAEVEHKLSDIKIKSALAMGQLAVMRSTAMLNIANAEASLQQVMQANVQGEFDRLESYVRVLMDTAMMGQDNAAQSAEGEPGGNQPVAPGADHAQGVALLGAQTGAPPGALGVGAGNGAG